MKRRSRKITALVLVLMMILSLVSANSVEAAKLKISKKGVVTVSTQKELNKALKNGKVKSIKVKTNKKIDLKIKDTKYSKNMKISINAPKATIKNNAKFKNIAIKDAKAFKENAKNNKIVISDKKVEITVGKNAVVKSIQVTAEGAKITLNNNGKVVEVKVDKACAVAVNGNKVEITLGKNVKPEDIKISGDAKDSVTVTDANGNKVDVNKPAATPAPVATPAPSAAPAPSTAPVAPGAGGAGGGGGSTSNSGSGSGGSPTTSPTPETFKVSGKLFATVSGITTATTVSADVKLFAKGNLENAVETKTVEFKVVDNDGSATTSVLAFDLGKFKAGEYVVKVEKGAKGDIIFSGDSKDVSLDRDQTDVNLSVEFKGKTDKLVVAEGSLCATVVGLTNSTVVRMDITVSTSVDGGSIASTKCDFGLKFAGSDFSSTPSKVIDVKDECFNIDIEFNAIEGEVFVPRETYYCVIIASMYDEQGSWQRYKSNNATFIVDDKGVIMFNSSEPVRLEKQS